MKQRLFHTAILLVTCMVFLNVLVSCISSGPRLPSFCINDKDMTGSEDSRFSFDAGTRLLLTCKNADATHTFSLSDHETGILWYEGPALRFAQTNWLIRNTEQRFDAEFKTQDGTTILKKTLCLTTTPNRPSFYPGILAHLIRTENDTPLLPPVKDFKPRYHSMGTDHPSTNLYAAYPSYRTSESVFRVDPFATPGFRMADYWRLVLPQPSLGYDDKKNARHAKTFCYPLGDLQVTTPTAALLDGYLMVETSGTHSFRLEVTAPARLVIGSLSTSRTNASSALELSADLQAGLVPIQITLDRRNTATPLSSYLSWKEPGQATLQPLDGARLLYSVPCPVESAYRTFCKDYPWRQFEIKRQSLTAKDRQTCDISTALSSDKTYREAYKDLTQTLKKTGSLEIAGTLLQLIRARFAYLREDKSRLPQPGGFGKISGSLLQHIEETRGLIEFCMRQPALQKEALSVQAEMLAYASIIHARSFFNGHHFGANDGYSDNDNFIVNCWRGARAFDSPIAFDAARSLYDNHFTYCAGTSEGLHTDGLINFHAANGRQINMGAYGHNWIARIISSTYFGTPWGNTQEQFRRIAQYVQEYEWFYYGGAMAFTANGRHNTHVGNYGTGFEDRLLALPQEALSASDRESLAAMRTRLKEKRPLEGNRFYSRHLLSIHRRADYYIDVKMNSPLVSGVETFAGANPGNLSFADGVTTLLRKGDEYRAIHRYTIPDSLWRFRSLPGTTQSNYETANLTNDPDRYRAGAGSRAGGVSDGEFGHCAFEFVSHPANATRVRKCFAFTEEGMFVLAAGLTGGSLAPTNCSYRSNLNQTSFKGPITIAAASGKEVVVPTTQTNFLATFELNQRYWIEHEGIGYLILPTGSECASNKPGKLVVRTSIRTPSNRISAEIMAHPNRAEYAKKCQELTQSGRAEKILEIWIDHGRAPQAATASYYVVMRPEKRHPAQWLNAKEIKIISNTPDCQAIKDLQSNILHAFFYNSGEISEGTATVSTKEPVSLMLRAWPSGKTQLTVQDPLVACTRDLKAMSPSIHLRINNTQHTITMPGHDDPDDRYRGGFATETYTSR